MSANPDPAFNKEPPPSASLAGFQGLLGVDGRLRRAESAPLADAARAAILAAIAFEDVEQVSRWSATSPWAWLKLPDDPKSTYKGQPLCALSMALHKASDTVLLALGANFGALASEGERHSAKDKLLSTLEGERRMGAMQGDPDGGARLGAFLEGILLSPVPLLSLDEVLDVVWGVMRPRPVNDTLHLGVFGCNNPREAWLALSACQRQIGLAQSNPENPEAQKEMQFAMAAPAFLAQMTLNRATRRVAMLGHAEGEWQEAGRKSAITNARGILAVLQSETFAPLASALVSASGEVPWIAPAMGSCFEPAMGARSRECLAEILAGAPESWLAAAVRELEAKPPQGEQQRELWDSAHARFQALALGAQTASPRARAPRRSL